jgi:DNA-directed RNA polymerase omega subunit
VIHPRIDTLLDNVPERYALVIVAAKRARQINNYHPSSAGHLTTAAARGVARTT